MTRTIVIGAGVAGLATAALLAQEGHEVKLLEKNCRVGGRAGVLERDGFRFDTGPSWYLMPRVFDRFFELLGTNTAEQLELSYLQPGYRVFSEPGADGRPSEAVTIPYGAKAVLDAFERIEPGSAWKLNAYLNSARHATNMAEKYFLYNPFTRPSSLLHGEVLRATPKLIGLLSRSLESYVAKRFKHPVLRQVLGYPAVFLGTTPADAPAMYHLMSALDLDEGVQYPMGGFWRIIERLEALAHEAGVQITTGAEAVRITTRESQNKRTRKRHREVTGVVWRDLSGSEHYASADIVVSGADLHHTETSLLSESDRSYPESWWQKRTSGPGAVIVMLGVRGELPELPHHSLFFAEDWQANFDAIFGSSPRIPSPASLYVCKPSATDPNAAPVGHENLFLLIPIPADASLGRGGSDRIGDDLIERTADAAIDQVASWAGIENLPERIVVRETLGPTDFSREYNSWRGGMLGPAHTLSQSAMFRAQNASKKVSGLYYGGATTAPGVGVPMCLISAELVLKRIRNDHSPGPLLRPMRTKEAV
ncbi:phytoene desaturase family protein [Lysinibacter sp. HNR]|uniref:phytoene desaturase family protein n=1 Tax=Lysinibacter sp. HNR TaxID=3031408 RepID=UPI002434DBC2|nr:phytoene desaturase family protein [Lysinibacter sp. HNR]WGD36410.1 phytoene desaturase family protein [Lysinibacter sp. HNR]